MSPVEFADGLRANARTRAGRSLADLERRLVKRLHSAPRCEGHDGDPGVCVYPAGPTGFQVSVTDCCCDAHARLARQSAEEELRR
jgi:hypothetical protein